MSEQRCSRLLCYFPSRCLFCPPQAVHTCAHEPTLSQGELVLASDTIMKKADFVCCRDSFLEVRAPKRSCGLSSVMKNSSNAFV